MQLTSQHNARRTRISGLSTHHALSGGWLLLALIAGCSMELGDLSSEQVAPGQARISIESDSSAAAYRLQGRFLVTDSRGVQQELQTQDGTDSLIGNGLALGQGTVALEGTYLPPRVDYSATGEYWVVERRALDAENGLWQRVPGALVRMLSPMERSFVVTADGPSSVAFTFAVAEEVEPLASGALGLGWHVDVSGPPLWKQVSAGEVVLAVDEDGQLYRFQGLGGPLQGELPLEYAEALFEVAVADIAQSAEGTACLRTVDGSIYCFRPGDDAPALEVPAWGAGRYVDMAIGSDYGCTLTANRRIGCTVLGATSATSSIGWSAVATVGRYVCTVAQSGGTRCPLSPSTIAFQHYIDPSSGLRTVFGGTLSSEQAEALALGPTEDQPHCLVTRSHQVFCGALTSRLREPVPWAYPALAVAVGSQYLCALRGVEGRTQVDCGPVAGETADVITVFASGDSSKASGPDAYMDVVTIDMGQADGSDRLCVVRRDRTLECSDDYRVPVHPCAPSPCAPGVACEVVNGAAACDSP